MKIKRCSIEGCDEKNYSKGLCKRHYMQLLNNRKITLPSPKIEKCSFDGCENKYRCSGYCQKHYFQFLRNSPLTPNKPTDGKCSVKGCTRKSRAKGMCSKHYDKSRKQTEERKNQIKQYQKKYKRSENGKEKSKAYSYKRRTRKANGKVFGSFVNKDVFVRDNYVCGICGLPVNPLLTFPDQHSASLDHIFPISKGGSHSIDNVTCSHWICNVRKNAQILEPSFGGESI